MRAPLCCWQHLLRTSSPNGCKLSVRLLLDKRYVRCFTHTRPRTHTHTHTQTSPGHLRTCLNCALLLTQNMLHILLEDWTTDSVQLVTSCRVTDLNGLCVDSTLPLYCTVVSYNNCNHYTNNIILGEVVTQFYIR